MPIKSNNCIQIFLFCYLSSNKCQNIGLIYLIDFDHVIAAKNQYRTTTKKNALKLNKRINI